MFIVTVNTDGANIPHFVSEDLDKARRSIPFSGPQYNSYYTIWKLEPDEFTVPVRVAHYEWAGGIYQLIDMNNGG